MYSFKGVVCACLEGSVYPLHVGRGFQHALPNAHVATDDWRQTRVSNLSSTSVRRTARQQPFELKIGDTGVGGVLGRDAEWDAAASALSRLALVLLLC